MRAAIRPAGTIPRVVTAIRIAPAADAISTGTEKNARYAPVRTPICENHPRTGNWISEPAMLEASRSIVCGTEKDASWAESRNARVVSKYAPAIIRPDNQRQDECGPKLPKRLDGAQPLAEFENLGRNRFRQVLGAHRKSFARKSRNRRSREAHGEQEDHDRRHQQQSSLPGLLELLMMRHILQG